MREKTLTDTEFLLRLLLMPKPLETAVVLMK